MIGAGRTDAGVHATGQVVSFRAAGGMPLATIGRGVNALLPADVAVRDVSEVDPDFHARYSATSRTYAYTIWNGRGRRALLRRTALWVEEPLDLEAMRRASDTLVGRHDFAAFSMRTDGPTERTVGRATWRADGELLVFEIEAHAYLRGMVRGIVGALVRVGRGKLAAGSLMSESGERAAPSVPPHGLCLVRVAYDGRGTHDEGDE